MIEVEIKLSNGATTSRAPCVRVLDVMEEAAGLAGWLAVKATGDTIQVELKRCTSHRT